MADSTNISNVFLKFSKKLEAFSRAEDSDKRIYKSDDKDARLQKVIDDSETAARNSVIETYSSFKLPASKAVDEDEEALFKAYNLYKAIEELNRGEGGASGGVQTVFIKRYEIENPIVKKDFYVTGNKFVYLQAWLYFEKGVKDAVPVIEKEESGKVLLEFEPYDSHHFSAYEKETLEIIRKNFYS